MAAAMSVSSLVQVREIPDEASLSVLGDCGVSELASSEYDCATKVDSTGVTTINMLALIIHLTS